MKRDCCCCWGRCPQIILIAPQYWVTRNIRALPPNYGDQNCQIFSSCCVIRNPSSHWPLKGRTSQSPSHSSSPRVSTNVIPNSEISLVSSSILINYICCIFRKIPLWGVQMQCICEKPSHGFHWIQWIHWQNVCKKWVSNPQPLA